ncbi:hypothetical protein J7426_14395 [Tropicibacter sp. R16_0]|uniref:DUF7146 domain-containing protein n=1 Tax=Tropicibacter sp. R16_0 TaxID=2821102 RepID=UPI001AD96DC1|nr:hypothetical protein [Tropicibacter sp. R16_0]MBO9451460.1 hypothetical protein [Tropicibacter sp. R16_0]
MARVEDDPRVAEAKARSVPELVDRLEIAGLSQVSGELIGPCPLCGGDDRFGINLTSKRFQCRRCEIKGGDTIALVMQVLRKTFPQALTWICGDLPPDLSPEERRRRKAKAEASQKRTEDQAEKKRQDAIKAAKRIWEQGEPPRETPVEAYLVEFRGLKGVLDVIGKSLRFHPDLPYMQMRDGEWVELHRGPAMLAAVQSPDGHGRCVHRTWLDLNEPDGKLVLRDKDGAPLVDANGKRPKVKKTLGSKQGGAIRLITPKVTDTIIMGEGIETTLTAYVAGPPELRGAAFWAGVDLGNMAGQPERIPGKKWSNLPKLDQTKPSFVPPEWVRRLIYIKDGDSQPTMTQAYLERGLHRARSLRPGLETAIVSPPSGLDLNDVLLGKTPKNTRMRADHGQRS